MLKNRFLLPFIILFSAGCTNFSSAPDPVVEKPADILEKNRATKKHAAPIIDIADVKQSLGMGRSRDQLGFLEKGFDPCRVTQTGSGCGTQYLVQIHFRLQCRDSEGTVSVALTENEIFPIADRELSWKLKGVEGTSQTDESGYSQIEVISPISQEKQWLRIGSKDQFLNVRAGEITRIVTPRPWCDTSRAGQFRKHEFLVSKRYL